MQKARERNYCKRIGYGPSAAVMCLAGLFACSPKVLPPSSQTAIRDSVVVRVNERTVIDTVRITLPDESRERSTRDTVSHLETTYAVSDAEWTSGVLHHTLFTKVEPVRVPVKVTVRDTVIVERRDTVSTQQQVIEVPAALTGWQRTLMSLGWALIALAIAGALWLLRRLL